MSNFHLILVVTLVASAILAAVYDLKLRIIPNWVNLAIISSGLLLHLAQSGLRGGLFSLIGIAAGAGSLLLPYLLGGMGAGDLKLMAALGAVVGAKGVLVVFIFSSLFGGLLAIAAFAMRDRVANASKGFLRMVLATHPSNNSPKFSLLEKRVMVPYGVAISCGALMFAGFVL